MVPVDAEKHPDHKTDLRWVILVALAAIVMGLPTLRGGFVGGDDRHLVLNHVLVNHPSLKHAVQLFGIVHRDLYQPIPLLSFSAEFVIANALGLFEKGIEAGQWLFHFTNILLHAVNAVLVWVLVVRLSRGGNAVATITALLFALHPLQVEVVAWVNGRMMLLSTLFALASLLGLIMWLREGRLRWAFVTVALVMLCMMSKVRVGVPVMMFIVAVVRGHRLDRRFWSLWSLCGALTVGFVAVNLWTTATSELFARGAEHMQGPRAVRVLLSLAWYLQHFVWPSGLASWYPAPGVVSWWALPTLWAALTLIIGAAVAALLCRRHLAAWLGLLWFAGTIVDTLPIVPARNILAADRYMYLPIIGLLWLVATVAVAGYKRLSTPRLVAALRLIGGAFGVVLVGAMIAMSWHVSSFYTTSIAKTRRIARLFPEVPHVWARGAWAHHQAAKRAEADGDPVAAAEHHAKVIELAQRELRQENPGGWSEAYQVMASTKLRLGLVDEAILLFQRALELAPDDGEPQYRLAMAYEELGRYEDALRLYEEVFDMIPSHNHTILRLAGLYRHFGRSDEARRKYEQALGNNLFSVPAAVGLAELDIGMGTREAYEAAKARLVKLLDWMPENLSARTALGVVHYGLGATAEAVECYDEVLARHHYDSTAALNLAQIYHAAGDRSSARALFDRAAASHPETVEQAVAIEDFYVADRAFDKAVSLWNDYLLGFPDSVEALSHLAWCHALAGNLSHAHNVVASAIAADAGTPLVLAVQAYLALVEGNHQQAIARVDVLCTTGRAGTDARRRLLVGLEALDERRPGVLLAEGVPSAADVSSAAGVSPAAGVAWMFHMVAQLLISDGKLDGARVFVDLFEKNCAALTCADQVAKLRRNVETSKR